MQQKQSAPGYQIAAVAAVAVLIAMALLAVSDPSFVINARFHTLIEIVSGAVALFIGLVALLRYKNNPCTATLFIALGFIGAGLLDASNAVLTSTAVVRYFPPEIASPLLWTWLASGLFLSIMLGLSRFVPGYEQHFGAIKPVVITVIILGTVLFLLACVLVFTVVPPSATTIFKSSIPRLQEFVPALFFLIALVSQWLKRDWQSDGFEFSLLLSLLVSLAVYAVFMPFSESAYDANFAAAHLSKIFSYFIVLIGLTLKTLQNLQSEVREHGMRLQSIVDMAVDAILTHDADGVVVSLNSAAERLFGYSAKEIIGHHVSLLIPQMIRREWNGDLQHYLATGKSLIDDINGREIVGRNKDGSTFPIEMSISAMQVNGLRLFTVIGRDISERKTREAELAQVSLSLKMALESAEQANHAKSDFLAAMSHEIRTPMNGVIGMIDVLHQTSLKGFQVEMVDVIQESASSLLTIIEDVLDLSKIEAGKMEVARTPIALGSVVENVCVMLDRLAAKRGVELTLFVDPAIPSQLFGDGQRLRQILINLINNAIKFSDQEGCGKVKVAAVLVRQSVDRVKIKFQVTDNGIGMDQETQAALFLPYSQAAATTSQQFGGTGLGLAITHQLVALMGGDVSVQSAPSKGASFTVMLPFETLPDTVSESETGPDVAGLSCLLVGGRTGLAGDLATYLAHAGATIEQVANLASTGAANGPQSSATWIWIVDTGDAPLTGQDLQSLNATRHPSDARPVFVLIERGNRRTPRRRAANVVAVDGNAMAARTFLKAVSIAANRTALEAELASSPGISQRILEPSRDHTHGQSNLVLVAEDNTTNQTVIRQQLSLLGYAADIASDGLEALDYWRSGGYALLLTDLLMPRMDGYELTEAIRAQESNSKHLPILALTANALVSEANKCREIGMDDYLSKPVLLEDLREALEKWLPRDEPASAETSLVDSQAIIAYVGSDAAAQATLWQVFVQTTPILVEQLLRACRTQSLNEVIALSHELKASARGMGINAMANLCEELEALATTGDADGILEAQPERLSVMMAGVIDYVARVD